MRVVQINMCYKTGSTGRTTYELEEFLNEQKIENYVVCGYSKIQDKNPNHYYVVGKIGYYFHDIMASFSSKQGFYSKKQTQKMVEWIKEKNPTVIHLRNLHGNCFHLPTLFKFLKDNPKIKVIWTTHDFWMISGWCATLKCENWKNGNECKTCKNFKRNKHNFFRSCSKFLFSNKKNWMLNIEKLKIQCVSNYCVRELKQSFLKEKNIAIIYNWIDFKKFYPRTYLKNEKPIILCVWSCINDKSQRFKDFLEVSSILKSYEFVCVGNTTFEPSKYPNIKFLGSVTSTEKLSEIYSKADVFFDPSTEDTFGKVVAESLSCGTPVVVYNSKALPELVGEKCGFVVEPFDINQACEAITKLVKIGKENISKFCVKFVRENFDYYNNCKKILSLYNDENL